MGTERGRVGTGKYGVERMPRRVVVPFGRRLFRRGARHRAAKADVVVVNTHLYTTSLAINEAELLPPHDLVVFDEAHELEDIASAALGFDLNQARLIGLARLARPLVADSSVVSAVEDGALVLGAYSEPTWAGRFSDRSTRTLLCVSAS